MYLRYVRLCMLLAHCTTFRGLDIEAREIACLLTSLDAIHWTQIS